MAKKTSLVTNRIFDSLVSNAIDFLNKSVSELKQNPKYSVINFCAGLEIFLKARLILEHWSLIVIKPENAIKEKFKSGEFYSVGIEETIKRLRNVAGEHFSKDEELCFKLVREHRNKLVHFFHPVYLKKPNITLLQKIIAEQCLAWYHLHGLLTTQWSKQFNRHQQKIKEIDEKMHEQRAFLKVKYTKLNAEIQKNIKLGVEYTNCKSCGFLSSSVKENEPSLFETKCLVCHSRDRFLMWECPDCGELVEIEDMGQGTCGNKKCRRKIDLEYLLSKFKTRFDKDTMYSELPICSNCEHYEPSVIPIGSQYYCLWCKALHKSVEHCEWCSTEIAGFNSSDSYLTGCFMCEQGLLSQEES